MEFVLQMKTNQGNRSEVNGCDSQSLQIPSSTPAERKYNWSKPAAVLGYVYNMMLAERIKILEKHKDHTELLNQQNFPTSAKYKTEFDWLNEVDKPGTDQCPTEPVKSLCQLLCGASEVFRNSKSGDETVLQNKCSEWKHYAIRWLHQIIKSEAGQIEPTPRGSVSSPHEVVCHFPFCH